MTPSGKVAMILEAATTERPRLLGIPELASYLGIPIATLYVWRVHGDGPPGIKVGRYVRYRPEDVEEWLEQRTDRQAAAANGAS